jgi:hypothetical protein
MLEVADISCLPAASYMMLAMQRPRSTSTTFSGFARKSDIHFLSFSTCGKADFVSKDHRHRLGAEAVSSALMSAGQRLTPSGGRLPGFGSLEALRDAGMTRLN